MELAKECAEFIGYRCADKKNKKTTMAGKLMATNFYHEQLVRLSTPLGSPLVASVKRGVKGADVKKGTEQRVRKPLTWELTIMHEIVPFRKAGGRVVWTGLALSSF